MRLDRLDLLRFGPFTDAAIDLSEGKLGLHLIYGANEAGKTSLLRAMRQFYFGIDARTPDNWLHGYSELRIGAVLRRKDGATLHAIRRKGNKATLRAGDDEAAVDEVDFRRCLGGLDQTTFESYFGLDHERLKRGGAEIVRGEGQLGDVLFAAGAGLGDVNNAHKALLRDAEEIYKKQGSKQSIALGLAAVAERRKKERESTLSLEEWTAACRERERLEGERTRLSGQLSELRQERRRCEDLRISRNHAILLAVAREKLAKLPHAPLLPEGFAAERNRHQARLREKELEIAAATEEAEKLQAQIADLAPDEAMLAAGVEIERLNERKAVIVKAAEDRKRIENRLAVVDADVRSLLRSLGNPVEPSRVDDIRLESRTPPLIRQLVKEQAALAAQEAAVSETIREKQRKLEAERKSLESATLEEPCQSLVAALPRWRKSAGLEDEAAAKQAAAKKVEQAAAAQLKKLRGWNGGLDEAERLQPPTEESVRRWEADFAAIGDNRSRLEKRLAEVEEDLRRLDRELQALRRASAAPSAADLAKARSDRDQNWLAVRAALAGGPIEGVEQKYEDSLRRADGTVDQMLLSAEAVARILEKESARTDTLEDVDRARRELSEANEQHIALQESWRATWRPAGVEPGAPREMLSWIAQHATVLRAADEARERRNERDELLARLNAIRIEVSAELGRAGLSPSEGAPLADLLQAAENSARREAEQRSQLQSLRKSIAAREGELEDARTEAAAIGERVADWRRRWTHAMTLLRLPTDSTPEQAEAVLSDLESLAQKYDSRKEAVARMAGIDRDQAEFEADVRTLAARLSLGDGAEPAIATAERLFRELRLARRDAERRATLSEQLEKCHSRIDAACSAASEARFGLEDLRRQARVASIDDLQPAETLSEERRSLLRQMDKEESVLHGRKGDQSLEDFAAAAAASHEDELDLRIAEHDAAIRKLQEDLERVVGDLGVLQDRIRRMEAASSAAADASQEAEEILAKVADDARRYAVLKLAGLVLREGVERFRARRENAILTRARVLFRQLTCGAYSDLRDDYNDAGKPELVAVREDGRRLRVDGLSEGAADQLYLALRLASLDAYLADPLHEPIPFVVDDILLTFDDERAAAALAALADLSDRTQVLFLTHHRHLVELAQEAVGGGRLFVHTLSAGAARTSAVAPVTVAAKTPRSRKRSAKEPAAPAPSATTNGEALENQSPLWDEEATSPNQRI